MWLSEKRKRSTPPTDPAQTSQGGAIENADWRKHLAASEQQTRVGRSRRRTAIRGIQSTGIPTALAWVYRLAIRRHIRVVNYHDIKPEDVANFRSHLDYYADRYAPVTLEQLRQFLSDSEPNPFKKKPGLIISFDDGFASHTNIAAPMLEEYGFTGWFFVPTQAPGVPPAEQEEWAKDHAVVSESTSFNQRRVFATWPELRKLSESHVVGSHTASHLRLGTGVDEIVARSELQESARTLSKEISDASNVCFCWVGGERQAYSRSAQALIQESGYEFAFRTNSLPITTKTNPLAIERTNIEADYTLSEVKFQLSGLTDLRYLAKRRSLAREMAGSL